MSENCDKEMFTKGLCVPRDLVVQGRRIQDLLAAENAFEPTGGDDRTSEDIFRGLIDALNEEVKQDKEIEDLYVSEDYLKEFVISVRNGDPLNPRPKSLDGISGFSTILYIEQHLIGKRVLTCEEIGLSIDPEHLMEYRSKLCGKICDYIFVKDTRSGHLSVEVIHEEFCTREAFIDCCPHRVTLYHWDINIPDDTYEVLNRDDNSFQPIPTPSVPSPFPPIPSDIFPRHSLDPGDERSIWFRCLDYKLVAKGCSIEIENVFKQVDCDEIIRLSESDYPWFYTSTEQSCVDIMFKGYPPAAQLPTQAEYCLGRCVHPPIINSGGK
ncbi:MAG: hypothetical protein ACRBM6_16030 [Geminicoccales bacterium]